MAFFTTSPVGDRSLHSSLMVTRSRWQQQSYFDFCCNCRSTKDLLQMLTFRTKRSGSVIRMCRLIYFDRRCSYYSLLLSRPKRPLFSLVISSVAQRSREISSRHQSQNPIFSLRKFWHFGLTLYTPSVDWTPYYFSLSSRAQRGEVERFPSDIKSKSNLLIKKLPTWIKSINQGFLFLSRPSLQLFFSFDRILHPLKILIVNNINTIILSGKMFLTRFWILLML